MLENYMDKEYELALVTFALADVDNANLHFRKSVFVKRVCKATAGKKSLVSVPVLITEAKLFYLVD